MVKSKDEIIASLKAIIGENDSDEVLTLLEDVSDTLNVDNTAVTKELEDLKQKYEALDADWRKRYRDRFFGDVDEETEEIIFKDDETVTQLTYDNLFETEGG